MSAPSTMLRTGLSVVARFLALVGLALAFPGIALCSIADVIAGDDGGVR